MVVNFDIDVYMYNISSGDSFSETFPVRGNEWIADLMTRVVNRYNASRNCQMILHPDSPYIFLADGSRFPVDGSILAVIKTCGALLLYVRRDKPNSLFVRVHARLIPKC